MDHVHDPLFVRRETDAHAEFELQTSQDRGVRQSRRRRLAPFHYGFYPGHLEALG